MTQLAALAALLLVATGTALGPPRPPTRFGAFGTWDSPDDRSLAAILLKKRYAAACVVAGGAAARPVRRGARFQGGMVRIGAAYAARYVTREPIDHVHEATAVRMEHLIRELRGAYVKSAQLISTAFPELLPEPWVRRLEVLVDDAPARPWRVTKRVLERELKRPVDKVFSAFEHEPVGAASIGQVHRATTLDNEMVAVKIMYPGGRQLVLSDLANVRRVLSLVKPALLPAVDKFRERVKGEFDYRKEARQMDACAAYLKAARPRLARRVAVPTSHPKLSTRRVLTMDWLDGRSLRSDLEARALSAKETAFAPLRCWRLLRLRRRAVTSLKRVARAQGAMIFGEDSPGFSADPHPGNIMVLGDGRLGLIDYGCACQYDSSEVKVLADLYYYLRRRERGGVVEAVRAMGFESKKMDETYIVTFATQLFDQNVVDEAPLMFLNDFEKKCGDKVTKLPRNYMLTCRVALLLRGLGARVGCGRLSMAHLWRREVAAARRRRV